MADLMIPGGGLTKAKLLLANANPSDVSSEKGFYSNGSKELQTGTLVERGTDQYSSGVGKGSGYIALNGIPEGIYRSNGEDWSPEIRINEDTLINYIVDNYRSKVLARLNISFELQVDTSLGTHGSTPYAAGYGTVRMNGSQIMRTGGESESMNGGAKTWRTTYKLT